MAITTTDGGTPLTRPEDEYLGVGKTLGYGVQHILAMFGGVIAVPLIVGGAAGLDTAQKALLVASGLFVSGLATMLQTLAVPFFGSRLPLVQGTSFATVSTILTILAGDPENGLRVVFGSLLVAAAIGLAITPFFARVIRFFPPVVTGSIITVIGLSLMPVAAGWITGQPTITVDGQKVANPDFAALPSIGLAMFTFLAVVLLSKVRVLSRLSVLLGLAVGTVVALIVGHADVGAVGSASVFSLPHPFAFGGPMFEIGAIVSLTVVILVTMVETTADILAVGEVVGTKVDSRRVADGLRADMASSLLAPVFNSFPATAFAQNVGLVALTGIKSRFAVAAGGAILLLLGLSPMAAAAFSVIPGPVLGGAGIVLFGTVAASGIRTLAKVDYQGNNNLLIVAAALAFGLIPVVSTDFWHAFPAWFVVIFHSGISAAAIVAVLLNLLFNVLLPGAPAQPSIVAAGPAIGVPDKVEHAAQETDGAAVAPSGTEAHGTHTSA
ncbi:nucleobase:cation symporter-2 family protein [Tsukamurella ocularis]|uniref:nucleobase:cation symporter-2 family protein n=1 Tax=Tsukamurella ocularis TaxID=1970234 RepID=UPI00216725EE|nr:nucleobase:cation symporter-2 family protein [Tsukamurella ocularis]MCS3782383.1 xanthine permease [Tsukamurella ocularis]MCS3789788.1 xanthine permease [Tsukamurella ocularis]MCS3853173.1 xanthine permease [Tsukamurella ocularis]